MNVHELTLQNYTAASGCPSACQPILYLGTAGSYGNEQINVVLGEGWQGLTVKAVFQPSGVPVVVPDGGGVISVPWEATQSVVAYPNGRISFQGYVSGRLVNTSDVPYTVGGSSAGTDNTPAPTPDEFQQFVDAVKSDADRAAQAAADAEAAAQAVKDAGTQAVTDIGNAKDSALEAIDAAREEAAGSISADVEGAKQAAAQAEQSAKDAAATLEKVQSAGQSALDDIATERQSALSDLQSEGTKQQSAVAGSGTAALEAIGRTEQAAINQIKQTGETQVGAVQSAGTTQISQINSAGAAQVQAVKDEGAAQTSALDDAAAAHKTELEAIASHPPQPNTETGKWQVWNAETGAYQDTDALYQGGYYTASVSDDGTLTWQGSQEGMPELPSVNIKGPKGDKGDPGLGVPSPTISDVGKVPAVNEDGTGYELRDISSNDELNNKIDALYNIFANKCTTKAELDQLFVDWWHGQWVEGESSYNSMLARWFGNVLHDDRVHGFKAPLFATSSSPTGEKTDDSVGLVCEPSTEAEAKRDDFAHLAQFWCVEVAAEKNTDGTHTIYACEFIDPLDVVRAGGPDDGRHLVWVLQKNTYTREWDEDGYRYFKMQCDPAEGWETWPQGTDRQNHVYPYMANPKYGAGLEADGSIGCRTGLPPVNYSSHNDNVALWRKRGSQYAGASGNLLKWQLAMIWLKYGVKGNSGTIEGHSSQNLQYAAAVSESGVQRILLTTAQASNFKVGYNVIVGTPNNAAESGQTNRGQASMYSIRKNKRVTKIETVEVGEQSYGAVYIEDGDNTFDTTAGTTYISNMPYWSGWNDTVQGNDGSRYNPTNGHDTGLIQKTEFMAGAYLILADELWQWGTDEDGNFTFDCYTCHDQTKVTTNGSISGDYEKQEDLTLTFPAGTPDAWWYIEDTAIAADRGVLWPAKVSTEAGSGTGVKDGFAVYPRTSGVRAGWCCCGLTHWGSAGLAARASYNGATTRAWFGCAGSPGLSG